MSLTPEGLELLQISRKGSGSPETPTPPFHWKAARKPAARAVPGTCHCRLWASGGFLRAGEDKQADSCPQQVPAIINGDQALPPLSLAPPKTGSAHVEMQKCRGLSVAWHCPSLEELGICFCSPSLCGGAKTETYFWGEKVSGQATVRLSVETPGSRYHQKRQSKEAERQKRFPLTDRCLVAAGT